MSKHGDLVSVFDLLLKRNVQHIWEEIFLSLEYDSFKNCLSVSKAWSEIFNRESFRTKIVAKYSTQMWMDTENLVRRRWRSRKDVLAWTSNGQEVAYVEDLHHSQRMHFIDKDGELGSAEVTGMEGYGYQVWILKNIILVKTDPCIFAVEKHGLIQSTISTRSSLLENNREKCEQEIAHYNPAFGVRILSYILINEVNENGQWDVPNDENLKYVLREVPFDYQREEHLRVCTNKRGYYLDPEKGVISFSEDGSRFVCRFEAEYPEGGIEIFTIDSGPQIRRLWNENGTIWGVKANASYVSYMRQEIPHDFAGGQVNFSHTLYIYNLDEETLRHFELKPRILQDYDFECNYNFSFTDKHLFASFSVVHEKKIKDLLLVIDLHTGQATHSTSKEADCEKDYEDDGGFHDEIKINDGKIRIQTNIWPDVSRILLSELATGDAEKVRQGQRMVTTKSAEKPDCDIKTNSVQVDDFTEVKPGLCLFEAYDPSSSTCDFVLETLAWPGEKLPRALKTWSEWLTDK